MQRIVGHKDKAIYAWLTYTNLIVNLQTVTIAEEALLSPHIVK